MDDPYPSRSIRALRPGLSVVETAVEDFQVRAAVVAGRRRAVVFDTLARPRDLAGADIVLGCLAASFLGWAGARLLIGG